VAELTWASSLQAKIGYVEPVEVTAHIGVWFSAPLGSSFVGNLDDADYGSSVADTIRPLADVWLDDLLGRATCENIAAYVLAQLTRLGVPASGCRVTVGRVEVRVMSEEVDPATWSVDHALCMAIRHACFGRIEAARNGLEQILVHAPSWVPARNAYGRVLSKSGDNDAAESVFSGLIASHPSFGEAYRNRGNIYLESGRLAEALSDMDSAVRLLPESALALNNRGYALSVAGDFVAAAADHRRAIVLDPGYREAYTDLLIALAASGQVKDAFDTARDLDHRSWRFDPIRDERAKYPVSRCLPDDLRARRNGA